MRSLHARATVRTTADYQRKPTPIRRGSPTGDATIADGPPVPVWLGRHELPIGDLGNPRVDAKILLAMLAKDGRTAALLREHGLDEAVVRARLWP